MNNVVVLDQTESVRLESERLGSLYRQMGPEDADDVVGRAAEELALRLSHCETQWRQKDAQGFRKSARSLVAIADQIGMLKLARVAGDVTACIDRDDAVATAATLARLLRVGETSLSAVWDLQDVTL